MGVVEKTVHRRAGKEWVPEEARPLVQRTIRGDDGGPVLVPCADELVELRRLVMDEPAEAQVVQDEQIRRGEAQHALVMGAVCTRGAQLGEELVCRDEEDRLV